ncbi:hypothetical protein BU17DRAFT_76496 [Hysterangium stoloniferum]|nr:hypothetical protein BU17DRAFT_76496 [Hysterangium stoloniferum]
MAQDNDALLAILEEQGRHFMDSFSGSGLKRSTPDDFADVGSSSSRNVKAKRDAADDDAEVEEWTGFVSEEASDDEDIPEGGEGSREPHVVVFNEKGMPASHAIKASRAFMSSKVARIQDSSVGAESNLEIDENADPEGEMSNLQNDALLHRLIHTKLLSGSLNPELGLSSAQRRKALAGRVLEIAGESKLGKGEKIVRQKEKQRASKSVRDGMERKQKERDGHALEEAKAVGNYHPALKKLFAGSEGSAQPQKRDRGLKMGVGRFSGGILKLSREDIGRVGDTAGPRGGGRGRGRGRGRQGSRRGGGKATGRGLKR